MMLELFVHAGLALCFLFFVVAMGYAVVRTVRLDYRRRQASRRLAARGGYLFDRERDDRLPL